MKAGYKLEQRGELDIDTLIAPNAERVAWVVRGPGGEANIRPYIAGIEGRHVRNGTEQRKALGDIAEEHYRLTTTQRQRFHDRRRELLGDPIWGWLAFVVATAVALVGWLG